MIPKNMLIKSVTLCYSVLLCGEPFYYQYVFGS